MGDACSYNTIYCEVACHRAALPTCVPTALQVVDDINRIACSMVLSIPHIRRDDEKCEVAYEKNAKLPTRTLSVLKRREAGRDGSECSRKQYIRQAEHQRQQHRSRT